ncbi:DUF294 nucleotidyltransferase-like domain-containing protein [Vibrio hannami]|uniref:DUF294 nucleotidyltransferase-like domain-containing protein n=1 Tax=Vibrio hannami TaxID=2717094 RepID=UPI003EB79D6D
MSETLLPNIIQFISSIDPFDKLPQPLLRELSRTIKISYKASGSIIDPCEQEDKFLYVIRTGAIEQRKPDGVLRARLGPEDIFGFSFIGSIEDLSEKKKYRAVAIENSILYQIPHSAITRLMEEHPEYAEHFASQAQKRIQSALDVVWSDKEKGLFVKKVSEVASDRVAVVESSMSIKQVALEMSMMQRSSCAVIMEDDQIVGLMTDKDMTKRVIAKDVDTDSPIATVMTPNPLTVKPDDLVLQAASLMMQNNIRNIPVVEDGVVKGLITTTHLVRNNRIQAIFLIEKINYARSIEGLAQLALERQAIFEALVEGKVAIDNIGKVMSLIYDAYTKRILEIAIDKFGAPPCEFTWMVAGSHARNEVHLLSDQDNALILSDDATASDRIYFRHFGAYVVNALHTCGYPLCTGNYMAAVDKWCQPISTWKQYYKKWFCNPEYERLLNITVFLEIRTVYGNQQYVKELQETMRHYIEESREFLGILVREATSVSAPLSIFNNIVLEKSGKDKKTLNVKRHALNPIIDLARIYGLASKELSENGTEDRFKKANEKGLISDEYYKDIIGTYQFISQLRLKHQLWALKNGEEPNNDIQPNHFGSFERKHLKDAFRIIDNLQDAVKLRFSGV